MAAFRNRNRSNEGLELQEEFAAEFRQEYKDKGHCPCHERPAASPHRNCKECVAIRRAHTRSMSPIVLRPILNQKIKLLSELTEHTHCRGNRAAP